MLTLSVSPWSRLPGYPTGGFAAQRSGIDSAGAGRLVQMCDEGSRDIAGLPVEQYRTIPADDGQRAALEDLATATVKAGQGIKAACPAETPLSAPGRLAAMQTRIEAMVAAVATVRPPLEKFYGLLSDEQKEKISGPRPQSAPKPGREPARPGLRFGAAECVADRRHRSQRASDQVPARQPRCAAGRCRQGGGYFRASCPDASLLTPTARLAAIGSRLDALLQGAKAVAGPLNDFYAMLDSEQKARFNGIALPQTSQIDQSKAKPASVHRRHFVSIG